MVRVCKFCGEEFSEPGRRNKIYCSRRCNARSQAKKRNAVYVARECAWCGAEFMPDKHNHTTQRFCSDGCKRRSQTVAVYGLVPAEYNALFEDQSGCCAICGDHQESLSKSLGVKIHPETQEVLGLLCTFCSTGLGAFDHDPELLAQSIAYLEMYNA